LRVKVLWGVELSQTMYPEVSEPPSFCETSRNPQTFNDKTPHPKKCGFHIAVVKFIVTSFRLFV
jgi:hypothetical protein